MMVAGQRYARQTRFTPLGEAGQARLAGGTAVVVGAGALGSVSASHLARCGVGYLRIIDRDLVEITDLHRQILYTEEDVRQGLPKAMAARHHLLQANSQVEITAHVEDLTAGNIDRLLPGADLVVDGTDNFDTRYLLNEWSVREGIPWIYGAAVGSYGLTFPILPGDTPCLSCLFESPPPADLSPTCETQGVLGPITGLIGSLQAAEAMKILAGREDAVNRVLLVADVWTGAVRSVSLKRRRDRPCPVCDAHLYPRLQAGAGSVATRLCGREAVQVLPARPADIDLARLARRLAVTGEILQNPYLIRFRAGGCALTVFKDGRALVQGTDDASLARSLVARYVGA